MDVSGFQSTTRVFFTEFLSRGTSSENFIYCLALAAACSVASLAKASTTITWSFATASGSLATTESYTGKITAGPALSGNPNLTITAAGYESQQQGRKKAQISPADLYGESLTSTVNGIGLNASTLPYSLPNNYQTYNEVFTYAASLTNTTTTYAAFVQLDLAALIQLASQAGSPQSATIAIAGISSADTAAIADSAVAGTVGKNIETIQAPSTGGISSAAFSLTNFTSKKHYLTITAPTGEILVNAIALTIPSSPSAVATPATATLVLTGGTAMGLMLLARRRK